MILSVAVHRQYRQITDAHDVDLLVEELATGLAPGNPWVNMDCGETAELYFADSALTEETFDEPPFDWQAHSMLTVSVNSRTGLGAVRWNLTSASVNPQPPQDPPGGLRSRGSVLVPPSARATGVAGAGRGAGVLPAAGGPADVRRMGRLQRGR